MTLVQQKNIPYILLFFIVVLALLLRYSTLNHHSIPQGDEGSFLSLASNISTGKGFTNDVIWHYYHKNESLPYPEDTRHPLYPFLVAGFGNANEIEIRSAQWLNVAFGVVVIILVFILGVKLHSSQVGLFASFLTAISWPFIKYSTHVYSEMLFTLLVLAVMLLYCAQAANIKWSKANYTLIGIVIGLSYLCRPNGIFIIAAAIVIALIYNRKSLVWIITGFFAVSIWWMGRNVFVFGNPLYGHFNYFMWIDSHHELWYTISEAPPGFVSYFRSHSVIEILGKFYKGIIGLSSELWKFEGISLPLNKILFPFFIWFLFQKKGKKNVWVFMGTYFLITLIPIIWTASVIWVARYLLVFYPFYFLAVSIGIIEIKWSRLHIGKFKPLVPVILIIIVVVQYYPIRYLISERNGDIKERNGVISKVEWIKTNCDKNAVILTGSLTQHQYKINRFMIHYPYYEPLEKVIQFSRGHGVTDFVIDKSLLGNAEKLKKYWTIEDSKIVEKGVPQYLGRRYVSDNFCVYTIFE